MTIRNPNAKIELQNPEKSDLEKIKEIVEKMDKKIDKLFKVLDYKYTSK